jgi:hypothetical protein
MRQPMEDIFRKSRLICLLLLLFSGGCSSTQRYAKLAEAGSAYTGGVATMADKAGELQVTSSSYTLLNDRNVMFVQYNGQALKDSLTARLKEVDERDAEKIARYREIRMVATNLKDYFEALNSLATSSASVDIATKTGTLIGKLNASITTVNPSLPLSSASVVGLMKIAGTHITEAAMKEELITRKATLSSALDVIHELDIIMAQSLSHHSSDVDRSFRLMMVKYPYVNHQRNDLTHAVDLDLWVRDRQQYIMGVSASDENRRMLDASAESYGKFREKFDKMVSGNEDEITIDELDTLLGEIKTYITIVNAFQKEADR